MLLVPHQVIKSLLRFTHAMETNGGAKPDAFVNVPVVVFAGGVSQMLPSVLVILEYPV